MPNNTFFNLPKEKQQTLIKAAKKEFSRVSLYEASISNIIKDANIPRGSFYQYFNDKEDIFFYLLDENSNETREKFKEKLKETNGNIFDTFMAMFRLALENLNKEGNRKFFRNAFLYMNHKIENALTHNENNEEFNRYFKEISSLIDRDLLNIQDESEIYHIWQILTAIMIRNIIQQFVKNLNQEQTINNFTTELELVKRGLYKEPTL
ncbi:TetR family transcriptional regulator [Halobacillus salinarum]|uniref:TetR family transcriptional regulator n=1 Tax=Halobacillus salinarum TaxID=2932257 RepID=A0ABY4EHI9_9BACI|nr:TetR family transcriptional regulator [Halobacillus salinarum]UOQ43528.1 TetR family transcriptional regulator [Halobacillus salinarum]